MAGSPSKAKRTFRAGLGVCIGPTTVNYAKGTDRFAIPKDMSRRSKPRNPKVPRAASRV
jgi:hypothetical protein